MDIQDIKARLSLTTVLNHYHLKPDRNHRLNCPFHTDKTPSFQIYPKTDTWTCFSSNCSAGSGDQIDFIMKYEDITKHAALLQAASMCGESTQPKPSSIIRNTEQSYDEIFLKLRQNLHRSPNALAYLKDRCLDAEQEIGYNSYQSTYKELQNCIIFPLKDRNGNIVGLYGRSITEKKGSNHYYTKNRKGLYPCYPTPDTTILIITEAIIDAATLLSFSIFNSPFSILSLYGANGWNEQHTEAIKSLPNLQEIIFFLDGDEAGQKAVETYATLTKALLKNITISRVNTPQGEDINSIAQNHPGQEAEILQHLIKERSILHGSVQTEHAPSPVITPFDADHLFLNIPPILLTILGGIELYPLDRMRVTLKIERTDSNKPLHRLRQAIDLYQDDMVEKLARKAAERLEIGSTKLHEALLLLTEQTETYRYELIESQKVKSPQKRTMTTSETTQSMGFLSTKGLLKNTNEQIGRSGVVGEQTNRLLMYLIFTSRLREQPLHIISLGGSGTGKTYLQEKIAELIPDEDKLEITAISENALYYFDRTQLKHKLILIEDLDGASDDKVLFAIRELQSKKKISKTIPIKDNKGNLKTITLHVEGPICLAGTTTRERLYEDNANRSILIYLDGSQQHREQIMDYQRKKSANVIDTEQEQSAKQLLQNVQSLLKPIRVINPYAEQLILPQSVFKPLRTNSHYLHFIETITFYHQYQREVKTDSQSNKYIETTIEDIEAANTLLKDVLLAKSDELTHAARGFLGLIEGYLQKEEKQSFYSGDLRIKYRIAPTTLNRHLSDLRRYGYLKIVSGSKAKGFEYELTQIEETRHLETSIRTAFDEALEKIKQLKQKNEFTQ